MWWRFLVITLALLIASWPMSASANQAVGNVKEEEQVEEVAQIATSYEMSAQSGERELSSVPEAPRFIVFVKGVPGETLVTVAGPPQGTIGAVLKAISRDYGVPFDEFELALDGQTLDLYAQLADTVTMRAVLSLEPTGASTNDCELLSDAFKGQLNALGWGNIDNKCCSRTDAKFINSIRCDGAGKITFIRVEESEMTPKIKFGMPPLQRLTSLTELAFFGVLTGSVPWDTLPLSLQKLTLDQNELHDQNVPYMWNYMWERLGGLQHLYLSGNGLKGDIGGFLAQNRVWSNLRTLLINETEFKGTFDFSNSKVWATLPALTELSLSNVATTMTAFNQLPKAMTRLTLDGMKCKGKFDLSELKNALPSLTELSVTHTSMEMTGTAVINLGTALPEKMTRLDLSDNKLFVAWIDFSHITDLESLRSVDFRNSPDITCKNIPKPNDVQIHCN